eukprot:TRINITY_DN82553_c0_g1_i1.p1 TRINITY_DN82553_c0_g1~~TRINITY_DN82553_c0_g1_i1.p1  ORF type:complete len:730 (-),score=72.45 TRINITY_DN82553_c0_g1_i1:11-2200(-)
MVQSSSSGTDADDAGTAAHAVQPLLFLSLLDVKPLSPKEIDATGLLDGPLGNPHHFHYTVELRCSRVLDHLDTDTEVSWSLPCSWPLLVSFHDTLRAEVADLPMVSMPALPGQRMHNGLDDFVKALRRPSLQTIGKRNVEQDLRVLHIRSLIRCYLDELSAVFAEIPPARRKNLEAVRVLLDAALHGGTRIRPRRPCSLQSCCTPPDFDLESVPSTVTTLESDSSTCSSNVRRSLKQTVGRIAQETQQATKQQRSRPFSAPTLRRPSTPAGAAFHVGLRPGARMSHYDFFAQMVTAEEMGIAGGLQKKMTLKSRRQRGERMGSLPLPCRTQSNSSPRQRSPERERGFDEGYDLDAMRFDLWHGLRVCILGDKPTQASGAEKRKVPAADMCAVHTDAEVIKVYRFYESLCFSQFQRQGDACSYNPAQLDDLLLLTLSDEGALTEVKRSTLMLWVERVEIMRRDLVMGMKSVCGALLRALDYWFVEGCQDLRLLALPDLHKTTRAESVGLSRLLRFVWPTAAGASVADMLSIISRSHLALSCRPAPPVMSEEDRRLLTKLFREMDVQGHGYVRAVDISGGIDEKKDVAAKARNVLDNKTSRAVCGQGKVFLPRFLELMCPFGYRGSESSEEAFLEDGTPLIYTKIPAVGFKGWLVNENLCTASDYELEAPRRRLLDALQAEVVQWQRLAGISHGQQKRLSESSWGTRRTVARAARDELWAPTALIVPRRTI